MSKDDLMTIAELARRRGLTEAAIRGRVASGHWADGVQYFRRGRRLMFSLSAVDAWFRDEAGAPTPPKKRRR